MTEKTKEIIKFKPETIKFNEIMLLSGLVFDFIKSTNIQETIQNSEWAKSSTEEDFIKLFTIVPEKVLQNHESIQAFIKIIEFVTHTDIEDDKAINNVKVIVDVLEFLSEVGIANFLKQLTMNCIKLTRG